MIHVFHGFLGAPEDFNFLKGAGVKLHDIYAMDKFPTVAPEDTLIGYSLGGRVALDIAHKNHFNLKKIVLMNSHPGPASEQERFERKDFEGAVLEKLNQKSQVEFMRWWNKLPIFAADVPIALNNLERFYKSAENFERYKLSNQADHLPEILKNKTKVLWIIGTRDEKYMGMAQKKLIPNGVTVKYMEAGHRLFQHPDQLLKILRDENIL